MELFKKNQDKIMQIPINQISPNPQQPRKIFQAQELESLAQSIRELGVLQPLTLRKVDKGWELIAGERRLRASELAGLTYVPCLQRQVTDQDSALLALVENIQRCDLDYLEEAEAIAQTIAQYDLSQEEISKRLGKSQSAVANLLRLLRLSPEVQAQLRLGQCTQRHARALLKLPSDKERLEVLDKVMKNQLNVSQTEDLIAQRLAPPPPKKGKQIMIIQDVRLFLNTIHKGLDMMKIAGVNAEYQKEEGEEEIVLTIKIPRNPSLLKKKVPATLP